MQTRLNTKQKEINTQIPINSLMKYLKIHPSDLPYAAGLIAGVVYLSIE